MRNTILRGYIFIGPILIACLEALLVLLSMHGIVVPNPVLFFSLAIILSCYLGGYRSGSISVIMTLFFLLIYWSVPGHLFAYQEKDLYRLGIFIVTMPSMVALVGALEKKNRMKLAELEDATNKLQESERRLQHAEIVAETGNWEVDVRTGSLFASEGARLVYGFTSSPENIKDVRKIPLKQYRNRLDAAFRALVERGEPYDIEFKILRPDDHRIVDIHSRATYDAAENKIFGTIQDVTAQKAIEADLRESREKAQQANRAKSEFLANMSHEIRTPLNGILGMLQALETTEISPEQQRFLTAAIDASKRLTQLLNDILDLSRVEAGKMQLRESPFDFPDLLTSIEDIFRLRAQENGLYLRFFIAEGVPATLRGDETRTRQILFNLIGNALKFTEQGGVTVSIAPLLTDSRQVRLLFTIADTGIGIPQAVADTLCQPFTQAGSTKNDTLHGAGLGLSIVKKLVALMDGEITIDSREGQGTEVFLSLPFRLADAAPPEAGAARQGRPQAQCPIRLRILLAEDDAISALACGHLLKKMHHTVVTAVNGREALARFAAEDFDLVFMDIQMPVLDGVLATRELRDRNTYGAKADTPVIALTAYAMAGDKERLLAAGLDDYVAKPVDKKDLQEVIARVMTAKRPRSFPAGCRPQA